MENEPELETCQNFESSWIDHS